VLERRASCVFVDVVRKKLRKVDKDAAETSVLIADPLPLPVAKGIAGLGLLAETIVKRYAAGFGQRMGNAVRVNLARRAETPPARVPRRHHGRGSALSDYYFPGIGGFERSDQKGMQLLTRVCDHGDSSTSFVIGLTLAARVS
jgi:hypothetical protein